MRMSLRRKFLLPTLLLIVLGMGSSSIISYSKSRKIIETVISKQVVQLTESSASNMAAWMKDRQLDVKNWAEQKIFQTALQEDFMGQAARKSTHAQFAKIKEDYQYYENICLANPKGELLVAADENTVDRADIAKRTHFQESLAGKTSISEPLMSPATKKPVFVISTPVSDRDTVKGVLFCVIDLEHFNRSFIDSIKVGETGYAFLFNKDGLVFAHPDKTMILQLDIRQFDFGKEMLARGEGFITYRYEGVEKSVAYKRYGKLGWIVGVGANTSEILAPIRELGFVNLIVGVVVVALAAIVILWLVNSTVKPVNWIVRALTDAAEEVTTGSGQVSSASQQLAEGASEQASGIEQTSSSLEEMSSMTRQNASNAGQAKTLMAEVSRILEKVNGHMGEMGEAIEKITRSSEETGKIIKTIDEIAFQTNLLALNAAVEAARAGEAGAGFAVVAGEVRNLAMRAADAAKDTSTLIENTIGAVKNGRELAHLTEEAFKENVQIGGKVGELVEEIAAASGEQAQGIDQVNRAVAEMDKVVQRVASSAEESASASEEMNAQAQQMKKIVSELLSIVNGDSAARNTAVDREGEKVEFPGQQHVRAGKRHVLSIAEGRGANY